MLGTIVLALLPLYLTRWEDAIFDGAVLVIAIAFSSDAIFRCVDPEAHEGNVKVAFAVAGIVILVASALQYGPIANDLRKEKIAIQETMQKHEPDPLETSERIRKEDETNLPNSSNLALLGSILLEFGAIIVVEN